MNTCINCGAIAHYLDSGDWFCVSCYKKMDAARAKYAKSTPPPPQNYTCSNCYISSVANAGDICSFCQKQQAKFQQKFQQQLCSRCGIRTAGPGGVCVNCFITTPPKTQPQGGTQNVPISCRIYWDDSIGGYAVSCSYKKDFIDFLKQNIPASDRAFHPNTKTWSFQEKYYDVILKTAQALFGAGSVSAQKRSVSSTGGGSPVSVGSSADPLTLAFAKFARLLPHDVLKKAYREAAGAMHPDKFPPHEREAQQRRMADLNEVWAQIKATIP